MARIVRLVTRPDKLRQNQAAELRQALLPFMAEMPEHVRALIGHIDRQTASRRRWTFVMLSPEQNDAVVNHILDHSKRLRGSIRVWSLCFRHLCHDDGEILLTREQIAEKVGEPAPEVSRIMSELEAFGAIIRRRERIAGMKGPGAVRYFMNPNVATHLPATVERDDAQAAAPQLRLVT
jgi:CRP-like cAMP-binding protein